MGVGERVVIEIFKYASGILNVGHCFWIKTDLINIGGIHIQVYSII